MRHDGHLLDGGVYVQCLQPPLQSNRPLPQGCYAASCDSRPTKLRTGVCCRRGVACARLSVVKLEASAGPLARHRTCRIPQWRAARWEEQAGASCRAGDAPVRTTATMGRVAWHNEARVGVLPPWAWQWRTRIGTVCDVDLDVTAVLRPSRRADSRQSVWTASMERAI
jgi:hypothetical protein